MRIVEILGSIPTIVNNEEHAIYRLVYDKGAISSKKMSDYQTNIADHLRQKGLLNGEDKNKETIYTVAKF